jgi:hypothetical protein
MGTADLWESATMGFQKLAPIIGKARGGRKALIAGTAKFTDDPMSTPSNTGYMERQYASRFCGSQVC